MKDRRAFIQKMIAGTSFASLSPFINHLQASSLEDALAMKAHKSPEDLASDEDFWYYIQQSFTVSSSIINLNNGGVSPQPKIVQEAVELYNRLSNEGPSYYMWRVLDAGREALRYNLADLAGCSEEEIAINRNSTEALSTIIFGLKLKKGDEVVLTKQDYPNMINAWKQREHRDGIVLKWLNFEFPIEDDDKIAKEFERAFTAKTKVVHLTHVINWNGQVLPVKAIADIAKKQGIEVLVDAAHSFAHLDFKIGDLNCDYLGTSLHKWLCAPFGSGLVYIKKEKIKDIYPLFGAGDPESSDIRKFENLGTRSFAIEQAIGQAINFHKMIGGERKQKRLYFLKKYWADKVKDIPRVRIGTSLLPEKSCAIALLQIDGKAPIDIAEALLSKYKIHTVAINWENISGVRITPNVYTTLSDLDKLVKAITEIAKT